jgi:hypothetical protein
LLAARRSLSAVSAAVAAALTAASASNTTGEPSSARGVRPQAERISQQAHQQRVRGCRPVIFGLARAGSLVYPRSTSGMVPEGLL